MFNSKKVPVPDPDYELNEVARERVRLKESKENRENVEKIRDIIKREFETEFSYRQSQLELIQQRLNQAQKTLHLLRYVLITSYYNKNELLVNELEEASTCNELSLVLQKNRLHPAVKKLLGNNLNNYELSFIKSPRNKSKTVTNDKVVSLETHKADNSQTSDETNINTLESVNIHSEDLPINKTFKPEFDTIRNRKKVKYRVLVGNISKWMPSQSEEDKSTHKWMVYVRGSKDNPDISHFVQKVIFYLHPSYQPNDVVELRDAPFHLSRRGWGEFPLRVRIFFKNWLNKPVDIIHNLKLDRTFTGRQTLGNETLVNLLLYSDETNLDQERTDICSSVHIPTKRELTDDYDCTDDHQQEKVLKLDPKLCNTKEKQVSYFEHNYCRSEPHGFEENSDSSESRFVPTYNYFDEHSYADTSSTIKKDNAELMKAINEQETNLIYGVEELETVNNEIIEEIVLEDNIPVRKSEPRRVQKCRIGNGAIISFKKKRKPEVSLLKKMFTKKYEKQFIIANNMNKEDDIHEIEKVASNNDNMELRGESNVRIDYKKYNINFPSHMFKNVSEALPYLFKRLPLVFKLASDINYKCSYPFTAESIEEYQSWNIGKRLSSEWFQAKFIQNLLLNSQLPDSSNYSVKSLIMYARSHGFTPLANYKIFKNVNGNSVDVFNGKANDMDTSTSASTKLIQEPDCFVDVINAVPDGDPDPKIDKDELIDFTMERARSYIKQAVLDVGIILKPEEIVPGVLFNAAERTLLQAVLCLAEDLIRRSRSNLVRRGNFRDDTSIILYDDVFKTINDRSKFHIFLKSNDS